MHGASNMLPCLSTAIELLQFNRSWLSEWVFSVTKEVPFCRELILKPRYSQVTVQRYLVSKRISIVAQ